MPDTPTQFVVFADDWGRHPSSCQHLFARIAPRHRVLWVNTIGTRMPTLSRHDAARAFAKARRWLRREREERAASASPVEVIDPLMTPLDHWAPFRALNASLLRRAVGRALARREAAAPVLVTTIPNAWGVVGSLGEAASVYYCVDDFAEWPGAHRESMLEMERRLLKAVDLVVATSAPLHDAKSAQHARVRLLRHGVDWDRFHAGTGTPPARLTAEGRPTIGFIGLADGRIDVPLCAAVARSMPHARFAFVGPRQLPEGELDALPNVGFLGAIPYEDVPATLHALDVAILPYVESRLTERINPLKALEILAAGTPFVATPLPELERHRRHVRLARGADAWVAALREALAEGASAREARSQSVRSEGWDERAAELMRLIEQVRRR